LIKEVLPGASVGSRGRWSRTGYYTNYGLSTFFPSTSVKQVGPLGNFPKAFEVDRVSSHQSPVLPNWASH